MARDYIRSLPGHDRQVRSSVLHSVHIDPLLLLLLGLVVGPVYKGLKLYGI